MQYSIIRSTLIVITLGLITTTSSLASNEYQYFIGGSGTYYDYGNKSKGEQFDLYLGGYFSPVSLEGNIPYAEAAYWQRKSSISLSGWKSHHDGFDLVRGATIFKSSNQSGQALTLLLAKEELPVWLGYQFIYHNDTTNRHFGRGQYFRSVYGAHKIHEVHLGAYVTDAISLYTGYYENAGDKTYEVGVDSLYTLDNGMSVGLDTWYAYTKERKLIPGIVNPNVLNLDYVENHSDQFSISGKIYPTKKLGIYLSYYHHRREESDNNAYTVGLDYYITPSASINLSVRTRNNSNSSYISWPEYTSTRVGLATRF